MEKERKCGNCNLCCFLTEIQEINKPINTICYNCSNNGNGCEIYNSRPKACSDFECVWLREEWPEDLRPDICHVMFETIPGCSTRVALMEPGYKNSWLEDNVQNKMTSIKDEGYSVVVRVGDSINILAPEGEDPKDVWIELKDAFRRLV